MAKNETKTTSGFSGWAKSKAGKITLISVGSVVALGASFGAGVKAGEFISRDGGYGIPFDRDGDHGGPGRHHDMDGGQMPGGKMQFEAPSQNTPTPNSSTNP